MSPKSCSTGQGQDGIELKMVWAKGSLLGAKRAREKNWIPWMGDSSFESTWRSFTGLELCGNGIVCQEVVRPLVLRSLCSGYKQLLRKNLRLWDSTQGSVAMVKPWFLRSFQVLRICDFIKPPGVAQEKWPKVIVDFNCPFLLLVSVPLPPWLSKISATIELLGVEDALGAHVSPLNPPYRLPVSWWTLLISTDIPEVPVE